MSLFKRKNDKYDLSDVLSDEDFIMDFGESSLENRIENNKIKPSHVITADELLSHTPKAEEIPMRSGTSASDELRRRMQKAAEPELKSVPVSAKKEQPAAEATAPTAEPETIAMAPNLSERVPEKSTGTTPEDFEQLITKLHSLVENTPVKTDEPVKLPEVEIENIDDMIREAEERAAKRASALYTSKPAAEQKVPAPEKTEPAPQAEAKPEDKPAVQPEPTVSKSVPPAAYLQEEIPPVSEPQSFVIPEPAAVTPEINKPEPENVPENAPVVLQSEIDDKPLREINTEDEEIPLIIKKPADKPRQTIEIAKARYGDEPQYHLASDEKEIVEAFTADEETRKTRKFFIPSADTAEENDTQKTMEFAAQRDTVTDNTASGDTVSFDAPEAKKPTFEYDDITVDDISFDDEMPDDDEEPEEDFPNDYTCIDDAPELKLAVKNRIKRITFSTVVTVIAAVFAVAVSFVSHNGAMDKDTAGIALFAALVVCIAANTHILKSIGSIFRGVTNADSIAAVALVFTAAHSLLFNFLLDMAPVIRPEGAAITVLAVFNIGKLINLRRVYSDFCKIATTDEKRAVCFIEKTLSVNSIVRGALDGPALITAGKRTVNINGFFKHASSRDVQSSVSLRLTVVAVAVAVIMGIVGFTKVDSAFAFTSMTMTMILFAAPATVLASALPLKAAADQLSDYGASLFGYSSAYAIKNSNVIAVDIADLFPQGSVKLYNMRPLSKNPIDKSLCEAAAVVMAAKSPLADIFAQITGSVSDKLPRVDQLVYEDRLGLSGWIDDRRILIGNRTLMENHNVKIPSYDVDKKILSKGFFPVYIASDSNPCVLLVVGYSADEDVTYELRRVCNAGFTVAVNSCDPNATADMICDYFGLPDGSVKTMNNDGIRAYKEETNYQDSAESVALCGNSACGLFALASAAIKVPALSIAMTVMNIISTAVGVAALACFIFAGTLATVTPAMILAYQLISTIVIGAVPSIFKP